MEDGHTLFDYDVGLNEIVQLMIRQVPVENHVTPSDQSDETKANNEMETNGQAIDTVSNKVMDVIICVYVTEY